MFNLRKTFASAITAAALGVAALSALPAEAHEWGHGWGHGWGNHSHIGHFRTGWGYGRNHFCFYHGHCGFDGGYSGRYRWGFRFGGYGWRYRWGGYPHYASYVASAPVTVAAIAAPGCPVGTHLGYLGKHCWPNRH